MPKKKTPRRTFWRADDLSIVDEPLLKSLVKYRMKKDRRRVQGGPNLVSSITTDGRQMPILDMDFPHRVIASTTDGHSHLYIDVPMSKWQWFWLMWGLWQAGVIELGFFVWSVRRGGNFVRVPGYKKNLPSENTKPTYGWIFKLKKK